MNRQSITAEFKRDTAALVVGSTMEAYRAMDVGKTGMRRWAAQLRSEIEGITPRRQKP